MAWLHHLLRVKNTRSNTHSIKYTRDGTAEMNIYFILFSVRGKIDQSKTILFSHFPTEFAFGGMTMKYDFSL